MEKRRRETVRVRGVEKATAKRELGGQKKRGAEKEKLRVRERKETQKRR